MSTIGEVKKLLSKLSPGEKAQVLQWVAQDLGDAFPGIDQTPGVCGGTPCIVRTRIPVWLLVHARQTGATEAQILQAYPELRAEDLSNAWAYYRAHAEDINAQILENEAA